MKQHVSTYFHVLDRNQLSDGTQILHINELPPPYSSLQRQPSVENDWNDEVIEIKSLNKNFSKYGFVISGGSDTEYGSPIIITHIDYCSKPSLDNGRTKLRLFDRICSVNNINLTNVTHDEAAEVFSSIQGQSILLHIRRLNPMHVEHIDILLPSDILQQPLGITITGGLNNNIEEPGLFISYIDPNGLLASFTKTGQLRTGDRLLKIQTNHTSANLQWVTHSMGIQLIRRICQDDKRVTLVVAHRTLSF